MEHTLVWHTPQYTDIHWTEQAEEGSGCLLSHLEQDKCSVSTQLHRTFASSWDDLRIPLVEEQSDLLHPKFNTQSKVLLAPHVGSLAWTDKDRKSWMGF